MTHTVVSKATGCLGLIACKANEVQVKSVASERVFAGGGGEQYVHLFCQARVRRVSARARRVSSDVSDGTT